MSEPEKNKKTNGVNNLVRYSGLFFQMVFIIGLFAFIGYKIDEHVSENHQSYYTAGFSLLGVIISIYQVLKEVNQNQ